MKYKKLTEKSSVVHIEFTTECIMVFLLILVNGKLKPRAAQALAPRERKVKDFDKDLQDEF